MPATDEDDRPKKKIVHEIGRLQANIASKQGSRSVADQFFKK